MPQALVTIILLLSAIFILAGIVITLVNLPGVWLIFLGYFSTAVATKFTTITVTELIVIFILSVISTFFDNVILFAKAKNSEASKWGILGAFLGAILGLTFFSIVGLIIGPFVGVVIFELIFKKKELGDAVQIGAGTLSSFLLSIGVRVIFCFSLLAYWIVKIII